MSISGSDFMALSTDNRKISTRRETAAPVSYASFLQTTTWFSKRNAARRRAQFKCERCGSKRDIEVHHKTYERLGNEWDSDLEVVCRICHGAHHLTEERAHADVYLKLVSAELQAHPFAQVSDIAHEVRLECVRLRVRIDVPLIDRAIALVCGTRLKDRKQIYVSVVGPSDAPTEAITPAQAVELIARIRAKLCPGQQSLLVRSMPKSRLVTQARAAQLRAFAMVTGEMKASIARCEELEQVSGS